MTSAADIDPDTARLLEIVRERDRLMVEDPVRILPLLFPRCTVRMLLVTDGGPLTGGLDFGSGDFGLRTFVETILGGSSLTTRFAVTLAHRATRSGDAMMDGDPRIAGRIIQFRFDDPSHFPAGGYDQVWLFGIERGPAMAESELLALARFMAAGGGLFATGDHGNLGKALGSRVPRARSMRLWDHTPPPDEVAMTEYRRNDTNRLGHEDTSRFDDQSDDVPQQISPKLYHSRLGVLRVFYPHPLLCSRLGVIDVMPDHPHEGECREPANLDDSVTFGGETFAEYPPATDGGPRPTPEVISWSSVLAGTTSGTKDPTEAHRFGGIAAYDGHRAGVGRVVTDATWHHFVNINLVGEIGAPEPKNRGFLATEVGRAHLAKIKTYYRNIAIWVSPPPLLRCMNRRWLWWATVHSRVVEAVLTGSSVGLREADPRLLFHIGAHARDVLGRHTSACEALRILLYPLVEVLKLPILVKVDPWFPRPDPGPDPLPWYDVGPLVDVALGGALLSVHEKLREVRVDDAAGLDDLLDSAIAEGVEVGLAVARADGARAARELGQLLRE